MGPSRPQGVYTNKTITPLQRPVEFAGRELLTAEEMANLQREAVDRNAELLMRPARRTEVTENLDVGEDGAPGYYNNFWLDEGTTSTGRTSIIVDPPDGRLPPLTPEVRQDEEARLAARSARGPADTWTDLDLNDRCMLWSVGPPMLPAGRRRKRATPNADRGRQSRWIRCRQRSAEARSQ